MPPTHRRYWPALAILGALLALAACATTPAPSASSPSTSSTASGNTPHVAPPIPNLLGQYAYSPQQMRAAFGIDRLIAQGYTGKGQTVVIIDSFGSPTLQQDVAAFDSRYGLPALNLQVKAPLGTVPFDPNNSEMLSWQGETTLDVEIVHAIAPDAAIVLLTSPVDETEGVQGLPQFLQLEQYAVSNHLGSVFSQSWGASEVSLNNAAGRQEVQQWTSFYQQATTQQGITFIAASGDNGATDCAVFNESAGACGQYSSTRTIGFPADEPWVTAVGGTKVVPQGNGYAESAWNSNGGASEGGVSSFFAEPSYQQSLPSGAQSQLQGKRGMPDVAGPADPTTGLNFYVDGQWQVAGGTSAASPFFAGVAAIANQKAGHALGFLNPAIYKLGASSSYSQDFFDVTSGDNSYDNHGVSVQGFPATPGWDLVTGFGAPNAPNFVPALVAAAG